MLDFIRHHQKAIQLLFFALTLPGFLFYGLNSFNEMGEKSPTVAVVAGKKIGKIEWDAAVKDDIEKVRQARRGQIDPKIFDSPTFKYSALERLVEREILKAATKDLQLTISDKRLSEELLRDPALAQLRKPDGKIDDEKYRALLSNSQGLTPQAYEARVRLDLSTQQVVQNLIKSTLLPAPLADVALKAYLDKRDIQVLSFLPSEFSAKISPSDAETETFYKANTAKFQSREQASIQYVLLNMESIKKTVSVSDAEIKAYYEQNLDNLSAPEERKASHILIAAAQSAGAQERQSAKAKAEDLLAQIKKAPTRFAEFAKKHSQDPGSAEKGGDLGYFARGAMVKPFEEAAFSLKPQQLSEVVESAFGFHIIQLTEIKAPKKVSFAEVKEKIEAELKQQHAQKKFSNAAEIFTNTVYEQSESLEAVAEKLKLEIKSADSVTREANQSASGALANQNFLNLLFTPESISRKRNTEAFDLGSNQLVAGRLTSYTPAQTQPYTKVKEIARAMLIEQLSIESARKEGEKKLAEFNAAPNPAGTATAAFGPNLIVSRDAMQTQNPKLIEAVMRTSADRLPTLLGVDLGVEGYRIVRLNSVIADQQTALTINRNAYLQVWSRAEEQSYLAHLRKKYKVEIKAPNPDAKVATNQ